MKTVTLKTDLFSKIILTVIALALIGLFVQNFGSSQDVRASYGDTVTIENASEIGDAVSNALISQELQVNVNNMIDASDIGYEVAWYLKK
jgi:hypothetical protein